MHVWMIHLCVHLGCTVVNRHAAVVLGYCRVSEIMCGCIVEAELVVWVDVCKATGQGLVVWDRLVFPL